MINHFQYRGQLIKELADHCEEYYHANVEDEEPNYWGSDLSRRQYRLLKCIFWVMCLGAPHKTEPTYQTMFNELKGLMIAWEKGYQKRGVKS
jgi:hypothetical protein